MPKSKRYSRMRSRRGFKSRRRPSIYKNVYSFRKMNAKVERVARMIPPRPELKYISNV